ncbi:DUF397 domain-containing protein [Actinocorallia sp. A-T 12471]|uniref:DUF397 domain-containing protein n=1 Tax=Actinocorallia sp. A-T 12471 TaxID=3089813 RepID=UPI0029D34D34|nr:DUF397 domain-containing protein [Actinocorallia sp. A-T 12471]MDX6742691.1 DUF397 domain-containing protein [Actinocorallia sp. A-T 12471]
MHQPRLQWRKSSYSGGGNNTCVELAELREAGDVGIRDSKNPAHAHLSVTRAQLGRLVSRIRTNEF